MTSEPTDYDSIAAVGVLVLENRFLVIERSQKVIAPGKICFPGGTVEDAETLSSALIREFHEELKLEVEPLFEVWTSVTPWRCKVHWWKVHCESPDSLFPDRREVAAVYWKTLEQLLAEEDLLESNRHFLDSVVAGEISL